jgi:Predicted membrane protein (DUF2231)
MAASAALAGLTDVLADPQIRGLNDAWLPAGGNVTVVLIELYNWYSRYEHGTEAVLPTGLILSDSPGCRLERVGDGLSTSGRSFRPESMRAVRPSL